MSTNYVFSNNNDFAAKYISRPGTGGYGGILTFSFSKDGSTATGDLKEVDKAFLCNSITIRFARSVSQMYFLNVSGTSYQIGRGTGSMTISGLLGSAEDFGKMFGANYTDPCKNIFTAKLDAFGMMPCDATQDNPGVIILNGVIPTTVEITASVQNETGALFYSAGATFLIAGLGVDSKNQSALDSMNFNANRQNL